MGKPLGGIWTERHRDHEMQLMVMHPKAFLCWRDLRQRDRDEQRIRMPSRASVISGNLILSGPMHSKALLCWRGSGQVHRVRTSIPRRSCAKSSQAT